MTISHLLRAASALSLIMLPSTAQAESLNRAVEAALNYHPAVEAALAGRDVAQETVQEQRAGFFPQLNAQATGGRVFADNSTSRGLDVTRGTGYSWLWQGNVSASQLIYDNFATRARVDAARERQKSQTHAIADIREQLALRTVQAYLNVLQARENNEIIKIHRSRVNKALDQLAGMVEEGAADRSELQQANDLKLVLENLAADIDGQLSASAARYRELTGHMPEPDMTRPMPELDMIPANVGGAVEYAHANHPRLIAARKQARAEEEEIDAERAALFPSLRGEVSYLKKDLDDLIGGEVRDARAVLRMDWSFAGGAELARISRSKRELEQSKARHKELKRRIAAGVRQGYAAIERTRRQLKLSQNREKLNQELLQTFKTQFEGGQVTILDLVQAQNQLFTAQLEEINAAYAHLNALYTTLAEMGRLQPSLNVRPAGSDKAFDKALNDRDAAGRAYHADDG